MLYRRLGRLDGGDKSYAVISDGLLRNGVVDVAALVRLGDHLENNSVFYPVDQRASTVGR